MSQLLHLFSSDYRITYAQDVLNALAAPIGYIVHWRYRKEWVSPGLDANGMSNKKALLWYVHMENQAPLPAKPCAHVPIRYANVIRAKEEAGFVFITLKLGSFAKPTSSGTAVWEDYLTNERDDKGEDRLIDPAQHTASQQMFVRVTNDVSSITQDDEYWLELAEIIYGHLRKHNGFEDVSIFRFEHIQQIKSQAMPEIDYDTDHYILVENTWYELQYKYKKMNDKPQDAYYVTVETAPLSGIYCPMKDKTQFGSPYDSVIIRFHTDQLDGSARNYSVLRINTVPNLAGVSLEFKLEVRPNRWRRFWVSTAYAAAIVLAGIPALMNPSTPLSHKLLPIIAAGFVTWAVRITYGESTK